VKADLEHALCCNAVATGLHSMLDQILLQPPYSIVAIEVGEGDAEDEPSCYFEAPDDAKDDTAAGVRL
jgi:hypothetical protein